MSTPTVKGVMRHVVSEPTVHGVMLVAGLVVIVASSGVASGEVLVKVLATLVVFWIAHVYAGVVAHLGDHQDDPEPLPARVRLAVTDAVDHCWGMLLAGLIPLLVLTLGVFGLISDQNAIWATLWAAAGVLGVLGFLGVASWTPRTAPRVLGAAITTLLGIALIALKALVH